MTIMLKNVAVVAFCLTLLTSCSSTARLYSSDDTKRVYSGTLDNSTNTSLRQLLATQGTSALKDTIIIKYDYNNEGCWNLLDQKDDNYIQDFIKRHQQRIQTLQATRPNVSVFDFREPGNNMNKIKKWDNSIIVDSSKQVMNLLFKDRSACGNSIIILPDRRFIFVRSDSHSEVLDMTQDKILEHILNK